MMSNPVLKLEGVTVKYGVITALHEVSLEVRPGEIVTLLGANGAGKTTALRTISGLTRLAAGSIHFDGRPAGNQRAHELVRRGLSHVPEGRMIFANLTVLENLRMGGYRHPRSAALEPDLEHVYELFPRLRERRSQSAGTLSGGEQQMLAIGRALMSRPRCLLLDEPSLGIAPLLVKTIFEKIVHINQRDGISILLVEQNARLALEISQRGYVLETGRIILADDCAKLRQNPHVVSAYLGG